MNVNMIHVVTPRTIELKKLTLFEIGNALSAISLSVKKLESLKKNHLINLK